MQFNPITNKLYTNDNKFIKKMYCPYRSLKWNDLNEVESSMDKFCEICECNVIETKEMNDGTLWKLLQDKPNTCLKIEWNQENVRIVHHV